MPFLLFLLLLFIFPRSIHAQAARLSDLNSVVASVISAIITLVGGLFIISLVVSGYNYLTAGSNKEAMTKAQQSLSMSLIGLVITVAAWTIVNLLGKFLGVDFSLFTICINNTLCS